MKKIFTLLALIFVFSVASAETVEYKSFQADDDGILTRKNSVLFLGSPLGVGIAYSTHRTAFGKVDSKEAFLVLDYGISNVSFTGNLGVGEIDGRTYFVGDTTARFSPLKDITTEITVFGDTIISNSSPVKTPYYGIMTNTELSNDVTGIVIGARSIRYADNNTQQGYRVRAWTSIANGVIVFAKYHGYTNSISFSPNYFSPDEYSRRGLGILIRQTFGNTRVSATVENTKIDSGGSIEDAVAWKLQADTKLAKTTSMSVNVGRDYGLAGGFEYRFAELKLKMEF